MTVSLRTARIARAVLLLALAAVALPGAAAHASILPAGSFVFDGDTTRVATTAGNVFVGGNFSREQTPTGSGLIVAPTGTGEPDPSAFPIVRGGTVAATVPDGTGGWYLGGSFTGIGDTAVGGLAHVKADLTVDAAFTPGVVNGPVRALALSGSTLYVGGLFGQIGAQTRTNLAAVSATTGALSSWSPAPNGEVDSLAVPASGATVYVGGMFSAIGTNAASRSHLAAVDAATGAATSWNPDLLGGYAVYALAMGAADATVYAGGDFSYTAGGGTTRSGLAEISASTGVATSWDPKPYNGGVRAIAVAGATIYVGGGFYQIGAQASQPVRQNLAALDATTGDATSWNPAPDNQVYALALAGGNVYVGGMFGRLGADATQPLRTGAGAVDATTGMATAWNPQPGGTVSALAPGGSSILVGGSFNGAGTPLATVAGLAKLDPAGNLDTSWDAKPMSGANPATISALTPSADGSTMYVAGTFTKIGSQATQLSRTGLAQVSVSDGTATSWNAALPFAATARQLLATTSTVYLAGSFSYSNYPSSGQSRKNLAAFDATTGAVTTWNPAPAAETDALALSASGDTIFAGGTFSTIGATPVSRSRIAELSTTTGEATAWDPGATWSGAPPGQVYALATRGSTVYVGFPATRTIGGLQRQGLAAIDATTGSALTDWHPDPAGTVESIVISGPTMYVGGAFDSIGNEAHHNIAALDADTGAVVSSFAHGTDRAALTQGGPQLAVLGLHLYLGGRMSSLDAAPTGPFGVIALPAPPPDDGGDTDPGVTDPGVTDAGPANAGGGGGGPITPTSSPAPAPARIAATTPVGFGLSGKPSMGKGKTTLRVRTPGKGRITVAQAATSKRRPALVRSASRSASRAGTYALVLKPTAAGMKKLRAGTHRFSAKVTITYTPSAGSRRTLTVTVTIRR